MTNKEQSDLAKQFPDRDVVKSLQDLRVYLAQNQDARPATGNKAKRLIEEWLSGASATRS